MMSRPAPMQFCALDREFKEEGRRLVFAVEWIATDDR
jgi:hypothetical protein